MAKTLTEEETKYLDDLLARVKESQLAFSYVHACGYWIHACACPHTRATAALA